MLAMTFNGDDAFASEYSIQLHMIENVQDWIVLILMAITIMTIKTYS